jgi:hypothetical protein
VCAEAVNFDAGLVIAYRILGLTAGELSQFDLVLDNFNKVIEMEGDVALTDFNEAISIDENYADARYCRGLGNLELSPKLSMEDSSRVIELDPDNEKYYLDRECVY